MHKFILLLAMLIPLNSYSEAITNISLYRYAISENINIAFNPGDGCTVDGCTVDWKLSSYDRSADVITGTDVSPAVITDPCNSSKQAWKITTAIPRSGLWYFTVKNCRKSDGKCSTWTAVDNINYKVNCQPGAWYYYTYVPAPGGIGF